MFFSKNKAKEKPQIENEREYIEWFLRNSDDIAHIRVLFDTDGFVNVCTKGATNLLKEYPNADALFDRVGDLAVAYETQMKPLADKQGGLFNCSTKMQGAVATVLANIAVGQEFLKEKYNHKVTIELMAIADSTN